MCPTTPSHLISTKDHAFYLALALEEAKKAKVENEVPIGAIVVDNGIIIGRGYNLKESTQDCTAHAEIIAIQNAQKVKKTWHLENCLLYSTLEPCPMCAGAILHSRLKTLVFGALDIKWGAAGTKTNLFLPELKFNHYTESTYHPYPECSEILTHFFKEIRNKNKNED